MRNLFCNGRAHAKTGVPFRAGRRRRGLSFTRFSSRMLSASTVDFCSSTPPTLSSTRAATCCLDGSGRPLAFGEETILEWLVPLLLVAYFFREPQPAAFI